MRPHSCTLSRETLQPHRPFDIVHSPRLAPPQASPRDVREGWRRWGWGVRWGEWRGKERKGREWERRKGWGGSGSGVPKLRQRKPAGISGLRVQAAASGKILSTDGWESRPRPRGKGGGRSRWGMGPAGDRSRLLYRGGEAGNCIGGPKPVTMYVQRKPRRQSSSLVQPRFSLYLDQSLSCIQSGRRSVT